MKKIILSEEQYGRLKKTIISENAIISTAKGIIHAYFFFIKMKNVLSGKPAGKEMYKLSKDVGEILGEILNFTRLFYSESKILNPKGSDYSMREFIKKHGDLYTFHKAKYGYEFDERIARMNAIVDKNSGGDTKSADEFKKAIRGLRGDFRRINDELIDDFLNAELLRSLGDLFEKNINATIHGDHREADRSWNRLVGAVERHGSNLTIDKILDKIAEYGEDSLTWKEKKFLKDNS